MAYLSRSKFKVLPNFLTDRYKFRERDVGRDCHPMTGPPVEKSPPPVACPPRGPELPRAFGSSAFGCVEVNLIGLDPGNPEPGLRRFEYKKIRETSRVSPTISPERSSGSSRKMPRAVLPGRAETSVGREALEALPANAGASSRSPPQTPPRSCSLALGPLIKRSRLSPAGFMIKL